MFSGRLCHGEKQHHLIFQYFIFILLLCNWSSMSHRALSEVFSLCNSLLQYEVLYEHLSLKANLPLSDWHFGSWIFSGTQRDQVCKCKRSAEKCVVVPSLTRTYDLNRNTRYTVQTFKYSVSFRTPCSVYYDPSSFFSVLREAQTLMDIASLIWSFLVCFCDSCVSACRFLGSSLYKMELTVVFPAILCMLQGPGEGPAKAPKGHTSWPCYSHVLYVVPCGLTWGAGPEMLFDTASFRLRNWFTPGFLLLSRIAIRVILPVVGQLS